MLEFLKLNVHRLNEVILLSKDFTDIYDDIFYKYIKKISKKIIFDLYKEKILSRSDIFD